MFGLKRFFAVCSFALIFAAFCFAHASAPLSAARLAADDEADAQTQGDVVLVLPFENLSSYKDFNWIGESFADQLSELLNNAGTGVVAVSPDEREIAYQHLRLPLSVVPSRATAIKLGQEAKATLVVLGTYEITPAKSKDEVPALRGTVRTIRIKEGRFSGELMPDKRYAINQFEFGDALTRLQNVQGQLAYQMVYQRFGEGSPYPLNWFVERATKVPPDALEALIKGELTADKEKKSNYLQNALRLYAKANAGATYPQAAFELGMLLFQENDWKRAAEYLSRIQKKDPHYTEAAFYASLCYWRQNDTVRALGALLPLVSDSKDLKLIDVYNNAGALAVLAARAEKSTDARAKLLSQAVSYLSSAAASAPEDPIVHFNYAYALLANNQFKEAAEQLKPVVALNARDGEAQFLLAKSLERAGQTEAANAADNEARRTYPAYAKAQTEWEKAKNAPEMNLRLRLALDRVAVTPQKPEPVVADAGEANAKAMLDKARELYAAGNDDEALATLRRLLTVEPMNAESYLLIGRINQRRGELDASITALKTALFWDSKLIDAHILLGRIFLERGDRAQARAYARSAMQLDPNNQEAIGLQRQIDLNSSN